MSKIKTVIQGRAYLCRECGKLFDGLNCRNLALRCFDSHQAAPKATPFVAYTHNGPLDFLDTDPRAGVDYPDDTKEHRWRRVKRDNPDFKRIVLGKSRLMAERRELLAMFPHRENWGKEGHFLQRLSQAYHFRRWESVKQAAVAYGFSEAVRRRLDELNIPQLIIDQFHLVDLFVDVAGDMEEYNILDARKAIQMLYERMALDSELNDIIEEADNDAGSNPTGGG